LGTRYSIRSGSSGAFVLQSQTPGGLLVVRRAGSTFVMTFGHAWQKLEDVWLEQDFGRRVALNSIARNNILEIRAEQVFAKWHVASERAPRASSVDEFGVEFDRDMVAAVEGVPGDAFLGKTIRGGTSLRVQIPFGDLAAVLDSAESLFASDTYKQTWPEIDNVNPVKDAILNAQLEAELDAELATGQAQRKLVMFTPSQRREEETVADWYVFGRRSKSPVMRPYLTVEGWTNFLQGHQLAATVDEAKHTLVHLLDEAKDELTVHSAFDCFAYELAHQDQQYILSSGVWYEVVGAFVTRINHGINRIPPPPLTLPAWDPRESEGSYNQRCATMAGFLHFDAKNIHFGGGQSKFEFCDLLNEPTKTLLFAKIPSKSSGMSHLVEQVRRTTELLFSTDSGYRRELRKVFKKYHPTVNADWLKSRPRNGDWKLCLVSLGRNARSLPFFAKCGLVRLQKDLNERGHEVSFIGV
jgi:uncharacterized protein (TIGR04141 family)